MLASGLIATFGYNIIPFKAYIIVAALSALLAASFLINLNFKKK